MKRWLTLAYGAVAYLGFLATFAYYVGFVTGQVVPRTVDDALVAGSRAAAIAIDVALVAVFAIQHTIMARPRFKSWWIRVVPASVERSTFVLATSAALGLMFWQWRSLPDAVWTVGHPIAAGALWTLFGLGLVVVLLSTFQIDHLDLFGLRQVFDHWRGTRTPPATFCAPLLYRFVRHPMMVGLAVSLWATPTMTVGHLVFAGAMTTYLVVGVQLEERDLARALGDDYRRYQERVPQLIPRVTPAAREAERGGEG